MSGLTSVQKNRLTMTIRELRRAPEWQDLKRFIQAASASDNPEDLNEVTGDICNALFDAINAEKMGIVDKRNAG